MTRTCLSPETNMPGAAPLTDTQTDAHLDTQPTGDRQSPDTQSDRRPACQWVTIREAMEVLDVSEATIHRRARRPEGRKGKLYKDRNDDGRVLIGIPCEEDAGDRHATVGASHRTGDAREDDFHVTVTDTQAPRATVNRCVNSSGGFLPVLLVALSDAVDVSDPVGDLRE